MKIEIDTDETKAILAYISQYFRDENTANAERWKDVISTIAATGVFDWFSDMVFKKSQKPNLHTVKDDPS